MTAERCKDYPFKKFLSKLFVSFWSSETAISKLKSLKTLSIRIKEGAREGILIQFKFITTEKVADWVEKMSKELIHMWKLGLTIIQSDNISFGETTVYFF